MKRHTYVSIMGTIGSGKTTVARLLARELKFQLLEEHFGENAFLPRFYGDMKRWAFHSQTFYLMEKITQMLQTNVTRSYPPAGGEPKDPHRMSHARMKGVIQDVPIQQDVFSYAKAQHVL